MDTFILGFELIHKTGKSSDLLANLSTHNCKSSPKLCLGHSDKCHTCVNTDYFRIPRQNATPVVPLVGQ